MTQALRYWEKKRFVFTAVLTAAFLLTRRWNVLDSDPNALLYFGLLWIWGGIVANVLYCVCYLPEIAFQISDLRETWKKNRWILFSILTLCGSILAWIMPMMFGL